VHPSSRTTLSTCRKIKYSSRNGDDHAQPLETAADNQVSPQRLRSSNSPGLARRAHVIGWS
jgi:hypothetical protein